MLHHARDFGRKRLLDTRLAATFHSAGVKRIVTTNERDFKVPGAPKLKPPQPQNKSMKVEAGGESITTPLLL
ncbi:hypothetical protein FEM03_24100 [Phragmitibacter flavus]|uniref:Uncharacterized protein n=1 Tax=Phragmitibacter flavus TaxID=2576071 RepID=A0A5R8K9H6_9BACT|nr:hypothetical protein [Phragmitibacter flavus]TLD68159.1 hypothetical protein FEM03_24100 [Phragmitibacter flavus]